MTTEAAMLNAALETGSLRRRGVASAKADRAVASVGL